MEPTPTEHRRQKHAEAAAVRQAEHARRREAQPPSLTREQFEAGEPCPGCGMPLIDKGRPERVGTRYETAEQRELREAEEARFSAAHPDCHAGRWSMSGSAYSHCFDCCPPHPLSDEQIRALAAILSGSPRPEERPELFMRWQLRLYCGHLVERTSHVSNKEPYRVGGVLTGPCPECGLDPVTIVATEPLGVGEPKLAPKPRRQQKPKPSSTAALQSRVAALEKELADLQVILAERDGEPPTN